MRPTARSWLNISVGLLLSLLVVMAAVAYRTIGQLQTNSRSVAQTLQVLEALERLDSTVADAETGERGYLLTGDDEYLDPYKAALANHRDGIELLAELTADNPSQQARIPRLRKLISDKLDDLAEKIAMRRDGHADTALQLVQTNEGRRLMKQIQSLIHQMEEDERELLSDRKWAKGNAYRSAYTAVVVIGSLALVALAVFVRLSLKRSPISHDRQPPSTNNGNRSGRPSSASGTA